MAKSLSRYQRGSMPDVPHNKRERDDELLSCGAYGPRIDPPPSQRDLGFQDVHPDLREILVRMDDQEAANLKQGLNILVRFEPQDFARLRSVLKLINIFYGLVRVLKWSIGAFFAGLLAVVTAGDQLQKIWGWIMNIMRMIKS